jgi:hypothetical protein
VISSSSTCKQKMGNVSSAGTSDPTCLLVIAYNSPMCGTCPFTACAFIKMNDNENISYHYKLTDILYIAICECFIIH